MSNNKIVMSDHFTFDEFTPRDHHILTPVQLQMLDNLCVNILEPIRQFVKEVFGEKKCRFTVSSGIRFPSDQNTMRRQGHNPSETSDHLFGNIVKLHGAGKIAKYGKFFQYSVGAADIIPECGAKELWNALTLYMDPVNRCINLPNRKVVIGQFILERGNGFWLHMSNPKSLIYSEEVSSTFLKNNPFLISMDNGKSYKPFTEEVL